MRGAAGEAIIVAVGLVFAYLVVRMSSIVATGAFNDDAIYISVGKALAAHEGYRSIYAVGAPVHMKYPPGLPALYAVLWRLGGTLGSVELLAINLALLVNGAAAALIWHIGRVRLRLSPPLVLLFAISPFLLESSVQYLNLAVSEPYFILGWVAALVLGYRLEDAVSGWRQVALAAGLGALVAGTTLIRWQAITLFAALTLALAIRRIDWRAIGAFVVSALMPLVLWGLAHRRLVARGPVSSQPDEAAYLDWIPWADPTALLDFVGSAVSSNWGSYWQIGPLNLSQPWLVGAVLAAVFLLLGLVGGLILLRKHPALTFSVAANTALVLSWPFAQDRFLVPILPFAGLLMASAMVWLARRWAALSSRPAIAALAVVVAIIGLRQLSIRRYAYGSEDPVAATGITYPSYFLTQNTGYLALLSGWALQNTSRDDRILVELPAGLYLHSGRRGVASLPAESLVAPSVFEVPGKFIAERIAEDSITVIAVGSLATPVAAEVAMVQGRCPEALQFVGSASERGMPAFYRVVHDDACLQALADPTLKGEHGAANDRSNTQKPQDQ
jgi:hypothetical protein